MGKPKRTASKGITKQHGPKRKMFHAYTKGVRISIAKTGVLSKYSDRESFALACTARGARSVTDAMWAEFCALRTKADKDAWLAALRK